jgi:hypothetical protein
MKFKSPQGESYFNLILSEELISIREFLELWFDLDFEDRKQSDFIMARILKVSRSTLRNWGEAPNYPNIPKPHHRIITHFHARMLAKMR